MDTSIPPGYSISITKEELASLPIAEFNGNICIIEDSSEVEKAICELRNAELIGFDTETRPSFKKGHLNNVSLIQLSTISTSYLFRINLTGFHQSIIDLLEDPSVVKIGLSTHDDFHNLSKITPINPAGFIDLQSYVNNFHIKDKSLSKIYGIIFGERISKGQRLTNWEASPLSPFQQAYAALDAQACLRIYNHINAGLFIPSESRYLRQDPVEPENTDTDL